MLVICRRFPRGMRRRLLRDKSSRFGRLRTVLEEDVDVQPRLRLRHEHSEIVSVLLGLGTKWILSVKKQQRHRDDASARKRDENAVRA